MPDVTAGLRGVIFDMDGLLLDSERIAIELAQSISAELGQAWPEGMALKLVGLNSRDAVHVIHAHMGSDYPVERHQTLFGERYEALIATGRIAIKPGAQRLLETLQRLGLPRVVATSTRRSRAVLKLDGAGLSHYLDGMVCGDEVQAGKPAPDIYLAAASLLGAAPGSCLALEDSNAGIRAALAAGCRAIMVPDLLQPADDIRAAAVPVLGSLHDVHALFSVPPGATP